MARRIKITTTIAALLVIAAATRVAVLAQAGGAGNADTHGMPPPSQLGPSPDNQKMTAVKVVSRVYDTKKLLGGPTLSEEAYVGQALWQQRCAYCHDGMGQPTYKTMGPPVDSDTVKKVGVDAVKAFITSGTARMPAFKYDLNTQQLDDIVEFVKTVSPSLRPTAAQLAGRLEASSDSQD